MKKLLSLLSITSCVALEDASADFYQQISADTRVNNSTAKAVFLTEYVESSGARCLDGSPAVYYFRPGTGSGATKWYLHHQGGGWCESWDDCLARSKQALGSSKGYPNSTNLAGSYFDPSPSVNVCAQFERASRTAPWNTPHHLLACVGLPLSQPMMYNWNIVYMRYVSSKVFRTPAPAMRSLTMCDSFLPR